MSVAVGRSAAAGIAGLLGAMLLGSACGPAHISAYRERERDYRQGDYEASPEPVSEGSLWLDNSRGLFADFRASRVGDIVVIVLDERADARGDASTEMEREASESFGLPRLFGFMAALQRAHPDLDSGELMRLVAESSFTGDGRTRRGSRVQGRLAVRVKRRMPNGDLFVEGTKVIMINDEEVHIYVSGLIRPEDIEPDNTVRSSQVADAQIEFSGRGALSRNQQQGWLARILSAIRPF